jgi:hypothetical protein
MISITGFEISQDFTISPVDLFLFFPSVSLSFLHIYYNNLVAVFRGAFSELPGKHGVGCNYFCTTYNLGNIIKLNF